MTSESIRDKFSELGHDIDVNEVASRVDTLVNQFKVPAAEAEKSVVSYFLRKLGVERSEYYTGFGENPTMSIADLPNEDGMWVNLRIKVVDVWENTSEHVKQVGIVGDETGKTKFLIWINSGLGEMELEKSYMLENVVTSLYNERISITLNKTSVITEIDDDIEVGNVSVEYTGVMVAIRPGSGLIKRCDVCNRALRSGACTEHGNVDGIYDIRIMGVLDNATSAQDVLLDAATTEELWGHTLDDAIKMAVDSLDAETVIENMRTELVGRYYTVQGSTMDTMILVSECEAI